MVLLLNWAFTALVCLFLISLWLLFTGVKPANNTTFINNNEQASEQLQQAKAAYGHLLAEIDELMSECRTSILEINATQNDAVDTLSTAFNNLKQLTEFQSEEIIKLLQSEKSGTGHTWMEDFAASTAATLDKFVETTVDMSASSMDLVEQGDTINNSVPDVLKALKDIDQIAAQTNLLALNAADRKSVV